MAEIVIPLRDQNLKDEVLACFAQSYNNPDNLTSEELTVLHISNFIRNCVNTCRVNDAVATAKAAVTLEDTLD